MEAFQPDERRAVRKVGHDLNNIVTVITGLCDLILIDHADDAELCEDVREIKENAERAGVLSERLRTMVGEIDR